MKRPMECFIGPCVLESESLVMDIAGYLKEKLSSLQGSGAIDLTFKGSFDKANRTSISSFRGPGIEKGLAMLEKVRSTYGFQVVTDIHLPDQAEEVCSVVDVVQIPAFLCRQTDMILAAAVACKKYQKRIKVKKGQFLAPEDTKNIVEKIETCLPKEKILLTERGTSFGYNNLIVDMASFQIMKSFGVKTIHDATHCVQKPGGLGNATGGKREQIKVLARAAMAAGADGVFIETHPNPSKALSDASTAMPLDEMDSLIKDLLKIYQLEFK